MNYKDLLKKDGESLPHLNSIPHLENIDINISIESDENDYLDSNLDEDDTTLEDIELSPTLVNYLDKILIKNSDTKCHFHETKLSGRDSSSTRKSIYTLDNPIWNPDRIKKYLDYRSNHKQIQDAQDLHQDELILNYKRCFYINYREQISLSLYIWDLGKIPNQKSNVRDRFPSRNDYLQYLFEQRINNLEQMNFKEIYEL